MAAAAKGVRADAGAASLEGKMAGLSVGVKLEDHPLTEEEITAIKAVHAGLKEKLADGSEIGIKAVVACTLIYKLRVERAIESYMDWKTCREEFGITSMFGEGWEDPGPELTKFWSNAYSVVGRDSAGRQVFWINGAAIEKEDEGRVIEAACMFFLGMYGDLHTLRNGITMVIDQSKSSKKTGNERKMQKSWQQFPNRPQNIFITGAGFIKRAFINGLIKFAALFSKQKILDRIKFCEIDHVRTVIPDASMPTRLGGGPHQEMEAWVKQRLKNFPVPKGMGPRKVSVL